MSNGTEACRAHVDVALSCDVSGFMTRAHDQKEPPELERIVPDAPASIASICMTELERTEADAHVSIGTEAC